MRALQYAFSEAFLSMWRERAASALSIGTIAAALLIFSTFLLITSNLERVLAGWSTGAEISVYLRDDASEPQRSAIERLLIEDTAIVEAREYVSKSEALARFKREFEDLAAVASTFTDNPFPASFEIRVRPDAVPSRAIDRLAERLSGLQGVADVRYDRRWLERLAAAITLLRALATVFAFIMIAGAALTVSNVVRLSFQLRRDEIQIMQLVGAPISYVRGPFLAEGIVQGGTGAVIALAILWGGYLIARQRFGAAAAEALGVDAFGFLPLALCVGILIGGMVVGCIGGLLATWGLGTVSAVKAPTPAEAI